MANVRQETLVVCLVESSVIILHEWNDVLLTYVSPLLQRIATAGAATGSRNDLRIGFVSYSDSHVHPNPILARRFFSPVLQLPKELNEDPSSLGIGRIASGGDKGMAILEGYTAVLEMFDAVGETKPPLRPHSTNETQLEIPGHEPTCYLIHVASSPPDGAMKPSWNTNPALDEITWASLPSELLKRKIRSSMILTRPVPELLDLHKHISRTSDQSWIALIKPSHRLLLSGLPPKETTKTVPQKRAATESTENPQQPAQPRPPPPPPPPQEQVTTMNPPAVTVTVTPPTSISTNNSSPSRPESATMQLPSEPQLQPRLQPQLQLQSQPLSLPPAPPPPPPSHTQLHPQPHPQTFPQQPQSRLPAALGQNFDPTKLISYIKLTEGDYRSKLVALNDARKAAKPQAELDALQAELNQKHALRTKLLAVYQQVVQKQQLNGGVPPNQLGNALNTQLVGSGPTQQALPTQEQPEAHITPPNAGPSGQSVQFSNFPGPSFGNKNPFLNMPISARAGMEAQMQKMLAERTRPPVLAAAPQTQPQPPLPTQTILEPTQKSNMPLTNQATNPNSTLNSDIMAPRPSLGTNARRWQGTLAWPSGPANAGVRKGNQLYIALFSQDNNLHCDSWPQKLILQPSRCAFNMGQIQGWVKEFSPSMALISSTPIVGNIEATAQNAKLFRQLKELIQQKNLLAYCKFNIAGGPPGTGFVTFPMNASSSQGDILVALIFCRSAMPAALTGLAPSTQVAPVPVTSTEVPSVPQPMNAGTGPIPLQNMSSEAKAFLQQRQAALVAYNQQQLVQQAHQQGLVTNPGMSSAGQGPGAAFNVAQFLQGMQSMQQQTDGGNQMGLGGLNLPQAPALQQVQHRQPSGFNPGQINTLQMLQYRRPDDGQG